MSMSMCPPLDPTIEVHLDYGTGEDATTLVIPPDCDGNTDTPWWWVQLAHPFFDYRYNYSPPSNWLPGQIMLSAVPGPAAIPIALAVHETGADTIADAVTAVEAAKAALNTAFRQPDLVISYQANGVTIGSWAGDPSIINWGDVDPNEYGILVAQGVVSVPVNPPEGA